MVLLIVIEPTKPLSEDFFFNFAASNEPNNLFPVGFDLLLLTYKLYHYRFLGGGKVVVLFIGDLF